MFRVFWWTTVNGFSVIVTSQASSCREHTQARTIRKCENCVVQRVEQQVWVEAHRDVEVDSLLLVIADHHRLDAHVGDIDGAREEEEDGQPAQQQAQQHRRSNVQLPAGGAAPSRWLESHCNCRLCTQSEIRHHPSFLINTQPESCSARLPYFFSFSSFALFMCF